MMISCVSRMRTILPIILACAYAITTCAVEERIFIDAKINGKPVRFAFDTGAGASFVLYSTTAQKLGLRVTPPRADAPISPGQTRCGWTDSQKLDLGSISTETCFGVVEVPAYLNWTEDGLIGWPALSNNVFSLDCVAHTINLFTNTVEMLTGWVEYRIQTNSDSLALELPTKRNPKGILALDSGSTYGVKLNPQKWHASKAIYTNQPMTLVAYYSPNPGLVVAEEAWASKISLGTLTLTDVPVMQADSADVALHTSPQAEFEATLGFAALKRLDIVIDGKHGLAYLRPRGTPPLLYEHNRLGAVFVPLNLKSDDLLARVINDSPAFEAGIRDGDVLLRIGNLDCTKWRTDPNVLPLSRFCEGSAGSQLELTLRRGDKILKAIPVLRNILPPDSTKNSNLNLIR